MQLLLTGFFGEGNLGDEALLGGIMSAAGPDHTFLVTAGAQHVPGRLERLPRRGIAGWFAYLRALPRVGRVVFSGGILQDWSFEGVTFYSLRLIAARIAGRRPSLWGAGLGPLRSYAAEKLAAQALAGVRTAWLRDADSCGLFKRLTGREASLGTDWSWATPFPVMEASLKGTASGDAPLGINLRPWFSPRWEDAVRRRLAPHSPSSPRGLLGIAARHEDQMLLQRLVPGLSIRLPGDFSELMGLCATLREGWAMRYHVLLAMLRAGIPVVPLPYDEKARSLCREAGVDDGMEPSAEIAAMTPAAGFVPRLEGRFALMRSAFAGFLESGHSAPMFRTRKRPTKGGAPCRVS